MIYEYELVRLGHDGEGIVMSTFCISASKEEDATKRAYTKHRNLRFCDWAWEINLIKTYEGVVDDIPS